MLHIELMFKDVYGKELYYPINDEAKTLCQMMKKKTFQEKHVDICRAAGWDVVTTGYKPKKEVACVNE